ncbi:MAG: hypothetical protein K2I71_03880 [Helicobacter sp.]|nr:hypothetical protein [Helicobacter sp.]
MKKTLLKILLVAGISVYSYGNIDFNYHQSNDSFNVLQKYETKRINENKQDTKNIVANVEFKAGLERRCVRMKIGGYVCFWVWKPII